MSRITVVGSINTDQVLRLTRLPRPGETVSGTNLQTFGGGKGANQAIAIARLGASVRLIGKVGTDSPGKDRLQDLSKAGIDVSGVIACDSAPSGIALILVADSGKNMIALAPGANGRVAHRALAVPDRLPGTLEQRQDHPINATLPGTYA